MDAEKLGFDYYHFVKHWPGTVCTLEECPDRWTIHGLWPGRNDGRTPNMCSGKFDENVIQELKNATKLEYLWPNLNKSSSNEAFWKHEWEKHGWCSNLGFRNYFNWTLQLAEQFDFGSILNRSGILKNQKNKFDDIKDALIANIGKIPIVKSKNFKKKKSLYQIEVCLDKELQLINCNEYIFYPGVKKASNNNQTNKTECHNLPSALVQANENECELSTNGQSKIQNSIGQTRMLQFSPIILIFLLWHCDGFF